MLQGATVKASQSERPRWQPVHTGRSLQPSPQSPDLPVTLRRRQTRSGQLDAENHSQGNQSTTANQQRLKR